MRRIIISLILITIGNTLGAQENRLFNLPTNSDRKIFIGKRISLNFQNISVRAVLQLLAEFTGKNIVVNEKVKGNITLNLNNIPWDQALDLIVTTQKLEKSHIGNVILINTKIKQKRKELKSPISSQLLQINYAKAADIALLVQGKHSSLLSEQGKLSVDPRTNTLWIQDSQRQIMEVKKLIEQLDVPVKQVLIEARIVEVSKDFSRDLEIRWGVSKPNQFNNNLKDVEQEVIAKQKIPYNQRLNLDLVAVPLVGATPVSVGIALAKLSDNVLLDLELSALESEGRAQLISSPRLIATNQQPAIIDSGQEIPYQESTSSGATAVSFKKAVLSLKVIPQITPDNKILMDLKINQDTASTQLFNGVPAIFTKEIQTNVLIGNGQTVVLGGIYHQNKGKAVHRVPFLGQIPLVGNLFKNTQVSLKDDELLIFITPKIIASSQANTTIEELNIKQKKWLYRHRKPLVIDEK